MSDEALTKLAGDVPGVLAASAQHMRKLATANVSLVKRASAAEHELRLMKLARRMEVRGLEPNLSFEEKVAGLQEVSTDKLAVLEQSVELSAGGFNLARVAGPDDTGSGSRKVASATTGELYSTNDNGADDLDEFVLSQQAFG